MADQREPAGPPHIEGISLWLVPTEPDSSTLTKLISDLSAKETDSPSFIPHITLLHPLPDRPVQELVQTFMQGVLPRLSSTQPSPDPSSFPGPGSPPPIHAQLSESGSLGRLDPSTSNNTAEGGIRLDVMPAQKGTFYFQSVLAPIKPTSALLDLRKACEDAYGVHPPKEYFPHLSLFYGDVIPERRDELASLVNRGADGLGPVPSRVTVKEVVFVDCKGIADGWKVLERVSL